MSDPERFGIYCFSGADLASIMPLHDLLRLTIEQRMGDKRPRRNRRRLQPTSTVRLPRTGHCSQEPGCCSIRSTCW